jgi:hypothetical protein
MDARREGWHVARGGCCLWRVREPGQGGRAVWPCGPAGGATPWRPGRRAAAAAAGAASAEGGEAEEGRRGGTRQRSGVKGAVGGLLRPGEKAALRREKIQVSGGRGGAVGPALAWRVSAHVRLRLGSSSSWGGAAAQCLTARCALRPWAHPGARRPCRVTRSPVSCRVVSCRVVSCRVVSCRVVSCRVVSCRVVSHAAPLPRLRCALPRTGPRHPVSCLVTPPNLPPAARRAGQALGARGGALPQRRGGAGGRHRRLRGGHAGGPWAALRAQGPTRQCHLGLGRHLLSASRAPLAFLPPRVTSCPGPRRRAGAAAHGPHRHSAGAVPGGRARAAAQRAGEPGSSGAQGGRAGAGAQHTPRR